MRTCLVALGLVVLCFNRVCSAAWIPPAGFTRTPETFIGDDALDTSAFAVAPDGKVAVGTTNFSGGANVKIYASAAAAQAHTSPIRTFTDPTFKAWGDLSFTDNDTLLITENGDKDTVYRGIVSSGAITALAPTGSVPNAAGVVQVGSTVYAVAANGPAVNAVYALSGGAASAALTNIGTGYLGGIAVDTGGNFLLTDTNDPTFAGNPGNLLRYTSSFAALAPISLAGGNGSGAYDVALDSEGDAFVTTGSTLTQIPHGITSAQQFGPAFTGFPFITNLDYVGSGFEPNAGSGKLFVNAVFSDDASIFGITPIPEPTGISLLLLIAAPFAMKRRRRIAIGVAAACLFAGFLIAPGARANSFFASQVISTSPGTQQQPGFTDPILAQGGPRGGGDTSASIDVYNLGNGGSITLGFDGGGHHRAITNGPGIDFLVFENPFYQSGDDHRSFAELMWVEVSTDGASFARFPVYSATPDPVPAFGVIDPLYTFGFAGVRPVYANVDENSIDPFAVGIAGGDAFDLQWIRCQPQVVNGSVDLNNIRFLRLVDVTGDGSTLDGFGRPIYDPTGPGVGGADVDAVSVINGVQMPEPAFLPLAGLALLLRRVRG